MSTPSDFADLSQYATIVKSLTESADRTIDRLIDVGREASLEPGAEDEILFLYDELKRSGFRFYDRWRAADLPSRQGLTARIQARRLHVQNHPAGWEGEMVDRLPTYPHPGPGEPVVYYLLHQGAVLYVGFTTRFRARMKEHRAEKSFTSWRARTGSERMEREEIRRLLPPLNRYIPPPEGSLGNDPIDGRIDPEWVTPE